MDPVVLACAVLPVTALLYGRLALRRRREARWYREAVAGCAGLVIDPYHAAVGRVWHEDGTQAAAARLLLDGLATVNHRGNLSLTPAGADPARTAGHPLPDALLGALRRRTAPAALGNIELRDTGFAAAREEFRADCRALLPRAPDRPRDLGCLGCTGVLLLLAQLSFATAALLERVPRGPVQWAAAAATGLALVAQIAWLDRDGRQREAAGRPDPLAERLARTGLHPALAELGARDPQSAARLAASRLRTRRGRNHGRPRGRTAGARAVGGRGGSGVAGSS